MIYIYDILVNFNDELYDFYEWNSNDSITHIRKIPLFKISSIDFINICTNVIKMDKSFLDKFDKKCEIFTSRNVESLKYAVLFSDGNDTICVKFDNNGVSKKFSKLLVDEAEEVIDVVSRYTITPLSYEIMRNNQAFFDKTRSEIEKNNYIFRELRKLEKNNDIDKLKYLFFECFDEIEQHKSNIIEKLYNKLNGWDNVNETMYNFFKLISVNR